MAKISPIITNFTAGEISPRMLGRVDFSKYANACKSLWNFLIMPQGGATKRPGTYHVAEVKNSANETVLIPFVYSPAQAYAIEAGNDYFRYYTQNGRLESPPGTPVETATTYDSTMVRAIKYAQSADVLFLAHPDVPPSKLERTGVASFVLNALDFKDGPYMVENATTTTLTPSATTGAGITVTASAVTGINGDQGFLVTDIGRLIRMKHGSTWGWVEIVGFTSSTIVTADVKGTLGGITATEAWQLGSWSDTTGYPAAVSLHENRLWWAGTNSEPQAVWASETDSYDSYAPSEADGTVLITNGLAYNLATDMINTIRWLSSGETMALGTTFGEFIAQGSFRNDPITPTNIGIRRHTTRGSADLKPLRIDTAVVYMQTMNRKLRELSYLQDRDSYVSVDISILAEHITQTGIVDWTYQQEPYNLVWMCRTDGELVAMTYNKEQDIVAFHRHPLGGVNVKAKSVCSLPANGFDELWLIVERTIGGATKKYVEYMVQEFTPADENDKDFAFFVDSGLQYNGAPATVFGGLTHLIGETVSIIADGSAKPNQVVNGSGQIILSDPASVVSVGLPYVSKLNPVRFEQGGDKGTSQGKPRRTNKVGFRFYNTLGGKYGFKDLSSALFDINFRQGDDPMDESPPLFTGDKILTIGGTYDYEGDIFYYHDQPYPATLLAIVQESVVYG